MRQNWTRLLRRSNMTRPVRKPRLESLESRETPAFVAGNLVVYRVGDGVTAPSALATPVFLEEYDPNLTLQTTPVSTISLPSTGTGAKLTARGNSTSEGQLNLSPDGKYLTLAGYNQTAGAADPSTATSASVNRTVAIFDSTGAASYSLFNNVNSSASIRGAVSVDGFSGWTSGANGGISYFAKATDTTATLISTTVTNNRFIGVAGGQLFSTNASGTGGVRLGTVGTGLPTTSGQTMTNLPGFPTTTGSPYGFFFADLDAGTSFNGTGLDTVYVCDDTAATGGIQKWSYNGANWSLLNTIVMPVTRSVTGKVNAGVVTLYATTGATSLTLNSIVSLTDSAGFGNPNNGTTLTTIATTAGNALLRGIAFVPTNSLLPTTLDSLTASTSSTSGPSITYTATFAAPVSGLTASNFGLDFTGGVTGTVGVPTGSGTTWTIPVTGISGGGTLQLKMVNNTGVSPPIVQFTSTIGTLVTVSPAGASLDVISGKAVYSSSLGKNNDITLSLASGVYTIKDATEPIALTPAAITAGWSITSNVPGNYAVSGPDAGTTAVSLNLGDGTDSFTLNGVNDPLDVQTTPGAAGSSALFNVSANTGSKFSVTGFDTISQGFGVTLTASTITFAGNSIGTSGTPINTQASVVSAAGGAGGVYLTENDGASMTLSATSFGPISVTNKTGLLSIDGVSNFGSGDVFLSSGDGVAINAAFGGVGSSGTFSVFANTDGVGSEGFSMSTLGFVTTSSVSNPAFGLTVNTPSGGVGNAVMGNVSIGATGTLNIDVNAGSIFSIGGTTQLYAGGGVNTFPGSINFTTSGANSAIGTSTQRIPFQSGNVSAVAGSGGIYLAENSAQDVQVANAIAQGAGDIDILTTGGSNNGLVVVGTITTGTGNIKIQTDDNLTVNAAGLIGGAMFSGKILCNVNYDGSNNQYFTQVYSTNVTVQTTSAASDAVVINVTGSTVNTDFSGAKLGNIKVGSGGGITVNTGYAIGNAITDPFRAGIIRMTHDNTVSQFAMLDAGPTGTVTLTARENPIGDGTVPILITAGTVSAKTTSTTSTTNALQAEGDIFVRTVGSAAFSGSTNSAKNATVNRVGDIDFSTIAGDLSLNGDVSVTTGNVTLSAGGVGNIGQTLGAVVTDGTLSLFPGGGKSTFTQPVNKAGTLAVLPGQTLVMDGAMTVTNPVVVDGTLAGAGIVTGTVSVSAVGKVSPGSSPGLLTTGDMTMVSGSQFVVELNGSIPGTFYDQLGVQGAIVLGGATLVPSLGYTPAPGQVFTIVDNDGADAVTGTFNGLAEGATVTIGATNFTISYVGGDGNDITLKAPGVAAPAAKVTSVVINNGDAQRSRVTTLRVNFDSPVTIPSIASAFTLNRVTPSAGSVTLNSVLDVSGTFVTITFTGGLVDGAPGKFSLQDGRYTLTAVASAFGGAGLDGDGNGTGGDNFVLNSTPYGTPTPTSPATGVFRLYGDANGNGKVESDDFLAFRLAFLSANDAFDFDGSGTVDSGDFLRFRLNFLAQIT
ncbi:MAG: hypothetical protein K1X57_05415 [Gemmataceae bacterium]|nr:hypothetical protein [Gemmataceae bacterium]